MDRQTQKLHCPVWIHYRLIMYPRHSSRYIRAFIACRTSSLVSAKISMSSMYTINRTPNCLKIAMAGSRVLVKTHGAEERPKGRQLNWYIFLWKLNLRYFLWVLCIGIVRKASFRSTFASQSPGLIMSFKICPSRYGLTPS